MNQPSPTVTSPPAPLNYFAAAPGKSSRLPFFLSGLSLSVTCGTYALYEAWVNFSPRLTGHVEANSVTRLFMMVFYGAAILGPVLAIILGLLALKFGAKRSLGTLLMGELGIALSSLFLGFVVLVVLSVC